MFTFLQEERFLFPVYPLIALCAAIGIDSMQVLWFRYFIRKGFHYTKCTLKVALMLLFFYVLLSVSRILVLYKGKEDNTYYIYKARIGSSLEL